MINVDTKRCKYFSQLSWPDKSCWLVKRNGSSLDPILFLIINLKIRNAIELDYVYLYAFIETMFVTRLMIQE